MYWHDVGWWAWIPMTLGMLVFWVLVAWFVVRLASGSPTGSGAAEPSARQVLDARFARGEIGMSEYEAARRVLEGATPTAGAATTGRTSDDAQRAHPNLRRGR